MADDNSLEDVVGMRSTNEPYRRFTCDVFMENGDSKRLSMVRSTLRP